MASLVEALKEPRAALASEASANDAPDLVELPEGGIRIAETPTPVTPQPRLESQVSHGAGVPPRPTLGSRYTLGSGRRAISSNRDHPRVRGEHLSRADLSGADLGSPPRAWGAPS